MEKRFSACRWKIERVGEQSIEIEQSEWRNTKIFLVNIPDDASLSSLGVFHEREPDHHHAEH
jgi:hypothetical protein